MKQIYILLLSFTSIFFMDVYGQSIDTKASEGAKLICDCTKLALSDNGVDVAKLAEIYNSYSKTNKLQPKFKSEVSKINDQLDLNYSSIETDIYICREKFTQKYKQYLSDKLFLNKMQTIINSNPYTNGPKLIKKLAKS